MVKIDAVDLVILRELSKNSKISNVDLSEIAGISPSPCLRRVKRLEQEGIIKHYIALMNEELFAYNMIIYASITTKVHSEEEQAVFETALAKISNVREVYLLQSDRDYMVKILVQNEEAYKKLLHTQIFKVPYIKKMRTTQIKRVVKQEYSIPLDE